MSRCPVKNCSRVASHRSGLCLPHAREGMRLFIVHATIPAQAHALEILHRLDLAGQAEQIGPLRARLAEVEKRLEIQARQCADCADRREQLVAELAESRATTTRQARVIERVEAQLEAEQRAHAETREVAHERAEEIARMSSAARTLSREGREWRERAETAEGHLRAIPAPTMPAETLAKLEEAVEQRKAAELRLRAAEEELRLLRRRMRDEPSALRRPAESSGVRRG